MARIVYACARHPERVADLEARLRAVCESPGAQPDHLMPRPPAVQRHGAVVYGILNPADTLREALARIRREERGSVLLGGLFGPAAHWAAPGAPRPDGSYALVRCGADEIELASDPAGSRTLWYALTDELFVAATSQRLIVRLLGGFEFEPAVLPWLLSTGTTGPALSWDRRIECVPPDSSVTLDRRRWTLRLSIAHHRFEPVGRSEADHAAALRQALLETFAGLDLDPSRWVLPLSGGQDSRAILGLLLASGRDPRGVRALTWGVRASLDEPDSDAAVAREVARACGIVHEFHPTDGAHEPADTVLDRFVRNGEGRIDHLSGYVDGFATWKTLCERGVAGIVRGDEGFGWVPVSSPETVRLRVGIGLCSDHANLRELERELPAQRLPEHLARRPQETLATWRDRLYHGYRIPTVLAALAELKFPYVEQVCPLLSRRVLAVVRGLPDALRTDKRLFRAVADPLGPRIPYARSSANPSLARLLRQPAIVPLLDGALASQDARDLLPAGFLARLRSRLRTEGEGGGRVRPSLSARWKRLVPDAVKDAVRRHGAAPSVDAHVLAWRIAIACRMRRLLADDARALSEEAPSRAEVP